jgi:hypothetical protein
VDGRVCDPKYDPDSLLPSAPLGGLLVRIGSGAWRFIGSSSSLRAGTSGPLTLAVNDAARSDNTGSYTVRYRTNN